MKYLFIACIFLSQLASAQAVPGIIPRPVSMTASSGKFAITKRTVIAVQDENDRKTAGLLNDYLEQAYGFRLDIDRQEGRDYIRISTRKFIQAPEKDAYRLEVNKDGVVIEGDTYAGSFYGIQTLIQLLPAERDSQSLSIPFVSVQDHPRFAYRGMHLDVARHFFPTAYVKRYIDYLALHKMNYFHWHLTDDQGWRIEIKKHPALTSKGAFRNGTIIGRYPGTANDNLAYGGFYTQEEVKDIVRYAAERHITVVPEIEMPGHSSAAIAAYPWLSCFPGEPTRIPSHPSEASKASPGKHVQETWGVFDDVYCAGKDSSFVFLQEVLDEVLTLFPSQYIHVGGDECPKGNWKRCAACQARIKAEGLKDEHELQSYFIQRMEKYLNAKGRTLIGWDEILEGGLAPNAVVMSWRGEAGGIAAAKEDHYVIMTPQKPVYFDHTQTKNEDSVVIGGYNPIEAVYAYEPVPKELPAGKIKYVLGAQANLWTEYIKNGSKVEYMVFPRMSALSEVLWSPREKRDWNDFERRLQQQFRRYELWGANYSKAFYDLKATILPAPGNQGLLWKIEGRKKGDSLMFYNTPADENCIDYAEAKKANRFERIGLHTAPYSKLLRCSGTYGYKLLRAGTDLAAVMQPFVFSKSTGKKASVTIAPNERYPGQPGAFSLVNGIHSNKGLSHPDWLGWIGQDMVATIDLGKKTAVDTVRMHTLEQNGSGVYLPQYVEVFVSADGKKYTSAGRASEFVRDTLTMGWITIPLRPSQARFIRVVAKNHGTVPEGKAGAGGKTWLFADELQVW
ncbi:MAG TPA: family 20 glycosylhydrolase [Flavisolibacter sp.]|nr:family 20 glycosylhydrolase [Flavisolibacter sp.]